MSQRNDSVQTKVKVQSRADPNPNPNPNCTRTGKPFLATAQALLLQECLHPRGSHVGHRLAVPCLPQAAHYASQQC